MKKLIIGLGSVLFLLCIFYGLDLFQSVPKVFSEPYRTAVEQEYRAKYEVAGLVIPKDNFWNRKIDGTYPIDTLQKKAKYLYREYKLLETEAKKQGKAQETIDIRTASWREVEEAMSENRQLIKNKWQTALTTSELERYYQEHLEQFTDQAHLKGKLSFWKNGVEIWNEELDISATTIRYVTELYPELEEKLPMMLPGEQHSWQKDGGYYQFLCLEREDGAVKPFDAVIEAVANRLLDEKIDSWLKETLGG